MAAQRLCSIPDCGKPHDSHGYCGAHAQRWRRHGDPLAGGTSHQEPIAYIETTVLPCDGDECLFWPYGRTARGYAQIHVGNTTTTAARVVCEMAYGPAPTSDDEAAHSCGKGHLGCVTKRHLSWKSHADNEADKLGHGTHQFGENNPGAKLSDHDAELIRALRGSLTQREIAARFNISQSLVSMIQTRRIRAYEPLSPNAAV